MTARAGARRTALALLAAGPLLGAAPGAGPFEDAAAAHARGDYATECQLIRPLAEHGMANAEFNLGVLYHDGLGVA
jgi:hypothetical protein